MNPIRKIMKTAGKWREDEEVFELVIKTIKEENASAIQEAEARGDYGTPEEFQEKLDLAIRKDVLYILNDDLPAFTRRSLWRGEGPVRVYQMAIVDDSRLSQPICFRVPDPKYLPEIWLDISDPAARVRSMESYIGSHQFGEEVRMVWDTETKLGISLKGRAMYYPFQNEDLISLLKKYGKKERSNGGFEPLEVFEIREVVTDYER